MFFHIPQRAKCFSPQFFYLETTSSSIICNTNLVFPGIQPRFAQCCSLGNTPVYSLFHTKLKSNIQMNLDWKTILWVSLKSHSITSLTKTIILLPFPWLTLKENCAPQSFLKGIFRMPGNLRSELFPFHLVGKFSRTEAKYLLSLLPMYSATLAAILEAWLLSLTSLCPPIFQHVVFVPSLVL